MQIRKITYADFFNATVVTTEMVAELAKALGLTDAAVQKLLTQKLAKASGNGRAKSSGVGDLPDGKLRTVVLNKLQSANDIVTEFSHGNSFEWEFTCLPDVAPEPDINAAGQNTAKRQRTGGARPNGKLQGGYIVVRKDGLRCTQESDPEKFALWQHVWNCNTFEQYFKEAPAKAVTRTGRIITASSEMLWAIKCGWVKPVGAEQ